MTDKTAQEAAAAETDRKELRALLDICGLTQRDLAELLGSHPMTVNRWLAAREYDTRPPPFYALQFLRVFAMLPDKMRAQLQRR